MGENKNLEIQTLTKPEVNNITPSVPIAPKPGSPLVKPITKATIRKKSWWEKMGVNFQSDFKRIGNRVVKDMIIPTFWRVVEDSIVTGVRMFLHGDNPNAYSKGYGPYGSNTYDPYGTRPLARPTYYGSYDYGKPGNDRFANPNVRVLNQDYNLDNIVVQNENIAREVVNQLNNIISGYKFVTVGALYELVGVPTKPTDYEYGWSGLSSLQLIPVSNGIWIKMPKAFPITN